MPRKKSVETLLVLKAIELLEHPELEQDAKAREDFITLYLKYSFETTCIRSEHVPFHEKIHTILHKDESYHHWKKRHYPNSNLKSEWIHEKLNDIQSKIIPLLDTTLINEFSGKEMNKLYEIIAMSPKQNRYTLARKALIVMKQAHHSRAFIKKLSACLTPEEMKDLDAINETLSTSPRRESTSPIHIEKSSSSSSTHAETIIDIPENINPNNIDPISGEYNDTIIPQWLFLNENIQNIRNKTIDATLDNQLQNSLFFDENGNMYKVTHENPLGKGHYGEANLAWSVDQKKFAVVKTTLTEPSDTTSNEYDVLKRFNTALGKASDSTAKRTKKDHLLMKLAPGISLGKLIKKNLFRFSTKDYLQLTRNLIDALLEIHQQGYLHCDIKPENIIVDPITLQVTIIDFGFACPTNNVPNQIAGTRLFLSPEYIASYHATEASDTYALGVTLMELFGFDDSLKQQVTKISGKSFFCHVFSKSTHQCKSKLPSELINPLFNILHGLTELDADRRITLTQARHELDQVILLNTHNKDIVYLVDINDSQLDEPSQTYIEHLRQYDTVFLYHYDDNEKDREKAASIKRKLFSLGVKCQSRLIKFEHNSDLIRELIEIYPFLSNAIILTRFSDAELKLAEAALAAYLKTPIKHLGYDKNNQLILTTQNNAKTTLTDLNLHHILELLKVSQSSQPIVDLLLGLSFLYQVTLVSPEYLAERIAFRKQFPYECRLAPSAKQLAFELAPLIVHPMKYQLFYTLLANYFPTRSEFTKHRLDVWHGSARSADAIANEIIDAIDDRDVNRLTPLFRLYNLNLYFNGPHKLYQVIDFALSYKRGLEVVSLLALFSQSHYQHIHLLYLHAVNGSITESDLPTFNALLDHKPNNITISIRYLHQAIIKQNIPMIQKLLADYFYSADSFKSDNLNKGATHTLEYATHTDNPDIVHLILNHSLDFWKTNSPHALHKVYEFALKHNDSSLINKLQKIGIGPEKLSSSSQSISLSQTLFAPMNTKDKPDEATKDASKKHVK